MFVVVWIVFVLLMLFLLGSAVGSFLNVCIVRLPQGRSLIRPASCCGECHTPIRSRDNVPLLSYWLLRGRCRACGAPFSMRYFWIELLTGACFVLIYHFEIVRNIHHFEIWSWYDDDYVAVLMRMFDAQRWLVFSARALLACFLIVGTMCIWEQHRIPSSVTLLGSIVGLVLSLAFPWPWPDAPAQAVVAPDGRTLRFGPPLKPFAWGPRLGAMPADEAWWKGEVTPRQGLFPWPVWGPLPSWLPVGSLALGLATGIAGLLAGALSMGLVRMLFNVGVRTRALGWGETHLMMIAGGFLGWQPVVVALLLGVVPAMVTAMQQRAEGRQQVTFARWLTAAVVVVWFGWFWIGPLVQRLFFNEQRMLFLAVGYTISLVVFSLLLRRVTRARRSASSSS